MILVKSKGHIVTGSHQKGLLEAGGDRGNGADMVRLVEVRDFTGVFGLIYQVHFHELPVPCHVDQAVLTDDGHGGDAEHGGATLILEEIGPGLRFIDAGW